MNEMEPVNFVIKSLFYHQDLLTKFILANNCVDSKHPTDFFSFIKFVIFVQEAFKKSQKGKRKFLTYFPIHF